MLKAEADKKKKGRKSFYRPKLRWLLPLITLGLGLVIYGAISLYIASEFTTGKVHDLGPDTPATYGMSYEDITYKTPDKYQLTIKGWWIPHPNSDRVIILVHAKDGTRTFLLPFGYRLWQQGFNLVMFDTRGQGQSEGSRYSFGWHEKYDVVGAVNLLKAKGFQPDKIGIVGWSMGAAISLQAMGQTSDIKAGVMESSFGNLERVVKWRFSRDTHLPLFFYPGVKLAAQWFFDLEVDQTNPEQIFSKLGNRKVFLIQTENDQEVPVSEYYQLLKLGGASVADSWLVTDSEHVRSFQNHPDEYTQRVVRFFNQQLTS
jgi:fermentation-respiration switch protein FrsA (DUF1100 family)